MSSQLLFLKAFAKLWNCPFYNGSQLKESSILYKFQIRDSSFRFVVTKNRNSCKL
ncbi:hypothetical protein D9M68_301930 [compost metagenome]